MESPFLPDGSTDAEVLASSSTPSLDDRLLNDASLQPSLLSESVSACSISTIASNAPPPFPSVHLQPCKFIELGDKLHMFSVTEPSEQDHSIPVISIPTPPRLKFMLKECLSIPKWTAMCDALQTPGHTPWGSVLEISTTEWKPEGSIFSPNCFSTALSHFRESSSKGSRSESAAKSSTMRSLDAVETDPLNDVQEFKILLEDNAQNTVANQAAPRFAEARKLALPSLVVSNSHFSFPLALESSHSLSGSLASRRGKMALPPIQLGKETKAKEFPYPEIPTAFLGSPSQHFPHFEFANGDRKPVLPFEEMITNLRLQCLTMSIHTPLDSSFDSRSCVGSACAPQDGSADAKVSALDNDEWNFATDLCYDDLDFLPTLQTLEVNGSCSPCRPAPRKEPSFGNLEPEVKYLELDTGTEYNQDEPCNVVPLTTCLGVKGRNVGLVRNATPPSLLRSAMTQRRGPHRRMPLKTVRFVLTHEEIRRDAQSSGVLHGKNLLDQLDHLNASAPLHLPRKSSSLRSTWRKARAAAVSFPGRSSVALDSTVHDCVTSVPVQESLGRHSLNRIINRPLFSASKDDRHIYLLKASNVDLDEKLAARENKIKDKGSRVPIPLRSLLTRFK